MKLDYARAIRTARAYCRLSIGAAVTKSGYSYATWFKWEHNESTPSPETLADIAQTLGITHKFLLVLALGWDNFSFDPKVLEAVPQYSMAEVYALTGLSANTLLTYKKDGVFKSTGPVQTQRCSEEDIQKILVEKARRAKLRVEKIKQHKDLDKLRKGAIFHP